MKNSVLECETIHEFLELFTHPDEKVRIDFFRIAGYGYGWTQEFNVSDRFVCDNSLKIPTHFKMGTKETLEFFIFKNKKPHYTKVNNEIMVGCTPFNDCPKDRHFIQHLSEIDTYPDDYICYEELLKNFEGFLKEELINILEMDYGIDEEKTKYYIYHPEPYIRLIAHIKSGISDNVSLNYLTKYDEELNQYYENSHHFSMLRFKFMHELDGIKTNYPFLSTQEIAKFKNFISNLENKRRWTGLEL
jgi:hypothetical protein